MWKILNPLIIVPFAVFWAPNHPKDALLCSAFALAICCNTHPPLPKKDFAGIPHNEVFVGRVFSSDLLRHGLPKRVPWMGLHVSELNTLPTETGPQPRTETLQIELFFQRFQKFQYHFIRIFRRFLLHPMSNTRK